MDCIFCKQFLKNNRSVTIHTRSCKENPNRIPGFWETAEHKKKIGDGIKKISHVYKTPEYRQKKSLKAIEYYSDPLNREKQSIAMKKAVIDHPESYSDNNIVGRSKHFTVDGVRYNSTWEYIVSKKLDESGIIWQRTKIQPVPYKWKDRWHLYFPDFFLPEYNIYIEVKGYETERDVAKWSQSDKPVLVIKQKHIDLINKNEYNILVEIEGVGVGHRETL